MQETNDPTKEVRNAIERLGKVLNVDDMHKNGGLKGNPQEIEAAWSVLKTALSDGAGVISSPAPGQGLKSIWLRAVYARAAKIGAKEKAKGWHELLLHQDDNLIDLVTTQSQRGYDVAKYHAKRQSDFPDLLAPKTSALDELLALSDRWATKWQNLSEEARAQDQPVALWRYERSTEIQKAGELLLSAIDRCEIRPESIDDDDFRDQLLRNLDSPDVLVWAYMTGAVSEDLATLVRRLAPKPAEMPRLPLEPYPSPSTYERDMWLYENMPDHTWQSLSAEEKKRGRARGWKVILSRNGIKEAADRFAAYHGKPLHRFRDD